MNTSITYNRAIILELAIFKAIGLLPNKQVRVTSEKKSYWVFNIRGVLFIGSIESEPLPPFFENQKTYALLDVKDKKLATLQKLIILNTNQN
jgi:hypothetical protein